MASAASLVPDGRLALANGRIPATDAFSGADCVLVGADARARRAGAARPTARPREPATDPAGI